jgi:hypothetical protein
MFFAFFIFISGMVRSIRDIPPAHDHYTFQIKNFSLLLAMEEEKYHSGQFEVGGYQWYTSSGLPFSFSAVAFFFFFFFFFFFPMKNMHDHFHFQI